MDQPPFPNDFEDFQRYPDVTAVRSDRLNARPSGRNAQGLFLPAACLFVGNLSTQVPVSQLASDLEATFSEFGRCHIKIKKNWKRQLPSAFVQFESISAADDALALNGVIGLHGRRLRIERAKGQRTAIFGYRNGLPINDLDVAFGLANFGSIESYCRDCVPCGWFWLPAVRVTYSYVADYQDAMNFYRNHDIFFMFEAEPLSVYLPPYVPGTVPAQPPAEVFTAACPLVPDPVCERPVAPISRSACATPVSDSGSELECRSAPPIRVRSLWPEPEATPESEPTPKQVVLRFPVKKGTKERHVPKQGCKSNGVVTEPLEPPHQQADGNTAEELVHAIAESPKAENGRQVAPLSDSSGNSTPAPTPTDSDYDSDYKL